MKPRPDDRACGERPFRVAQVGPPIHSSLHLLERLASCLAYETPHEGRWKGIRVFGQPASMEIYDLQNDLGEETNLATRNAEVRARIEQIMATAHVDNEHWKLAAPPVKAGAKKGKFK